MIESMNEVMMDSEMDSEMSRPEPLNQSNSTVPPEPVKRHNRSNTLELFAKAMERERKRRNCIAKKRFKGFEHTSFEVDHAGKGTRAHKLLLTTELVLLLV